MFRKTSMTAMSVAALALAMGVTGPSQAEDEALPGELLAWMDGEWQGQGWVIDRTGQRHTFDVFETAEIRAGGQAVVVAGEGFAPAGTGREGRKVHDAAGFITAAGSPGYQMRAITYQGYMQDADMVLTETGFEWSIDLGQDARVVYTTTYQDGVWSETGAYCSPQTGCMENFSMRLERVD